MEKEIYIASPLVYSRRIHRDGSDYKAEYRTYVSRVDGSYLRIRGVCFSEKIRS